MPSKRKRKPVSAATRAKISASLKKKHRHVHPSQATRAKISAALRKRHAHHKNSAATREKISKALRGRHHKGQRHHFSEKRVHAHPVRLRRRHVRPHGHLVVRQHHGQLLHHRKSRPKSLHGRGHLLHPRKSRRRSGHLV